MSTIPESKVSSTFLEKKDPLTNHPSKKKVMNLIEEETCSASNGSIDKEKEEGHVGLNIIDRKDEEEDEGPKPFSIMEKGHDSLSSPSDQGKEKIHEVKCKSPERGCLRGEVEEECTSRFLVGDLHITAQYVGLCMAKDTSFGSDPKSDYKSELDSP